MPLIPLSDTSGAYWFDVGVGGVGTQALIDALLADPRLDAVPTTYGPDQPEYR